MSKFEQPRNPVIELVRKGDDSQEVVAWACSKCGRVNTKDVAERCCIDWVCEECGKQTHRYWTLCPDCRRTREAEKLIERADKAERVDAAEYSGPVYCDGHGYHDGFFQSTDDLIDYCADEEIQDPGPVFACHSHKLALDADDTIDCALEDHHEDAEAECVDELRGFIKGWNEKQSAETWEPDYRRVIVRIQFAEIEQWATEQR